MARKLGQRVKIVAGMREFLGQTGRIIDTEGKRPVMYRVRLDEPLYVENVGTVTSDLWENAGLVSIR